MLLKHILFILLLSLLNSVQAIEYQSNTAFLSHVFNNQPPKPQLLWLTSQIKTDAETILQHKLRFLRTRYWKNTEQSVWIINEIGKTKAITVAVVIQDQQIKQLKVLAFRESRGWEVKHDFFTQQFEHNQLTADLRLSKPIDGISGATLSVRALKKIAKLALLFNQQTL